MNSIGLGATRWDSKAALDQLFVSWSLINARVRSVVRIRCSTTAGHSSIVKDVVPATCRRAGLAKRTRLTGCSTRPLPTSPREACR